MDRSTEGAGNESRLASYLEHLASTLGHADRRAPFGFYCKGLILPGERKSVEPIAARVEPSRVQGAHQSLHHFVANADWSQEALLRQVRTFVLPAIEKSGGVRAWIVDDTGFPKKGVHSVGVARQYCGQLGKNGRRTKARRPNTGSRPWQRIQPSRGSWKLPNCAGGSSATIRNSSRNGGFKRSSQHDLCRLIGETGQAPLRVSSNQASFWAAS